MFSFEMSYCICKYFRNFVKSYIRPFYCIWFGERRDTWLKTRYIASAIAGIFLAWLICQLILISFSFSKKNKIILSVFLCIVVGLGYIFTDSVKCVTLMMFIALIGKSGRSYLRALCFAYIIAGPIGNLTLNVTEVVRVFSCSTVLQYNLTRTHFDLMTKPLQRTLSNMKEDIESLRGTFRDLKQVTQVIHKEVMGEDPPLEEILEKDDDILSNVTLYKKFPEYGMESSRTESNELSPTNFMIETMNHEKEYIRNTADDDNTYNISRMIKLQPIWTRQNIENDSELIQRKYSNKIKKRCEFQLENGKVRCRKAFAKTLQKCEDTLPIIINKLLCWPLRVDFICNLNILGDQENICNPENALPNNFGETFVELSKTENELYDDNEDVKVNYSIASYNSSKELESAKQTATSVMRDFNARKRIFESIVMQLQRFLAFMAYRVLLACISYHKNYKKDYDHDNVYISEYFKHVDRRRKEQGKRSLLPLKNFEKKNLIDTKKYWKQTKQESRDAGYHLLQFSMEIFTGTFFLLLDYTITVLLEIVRDHSEVAYIQEGEHNIQFSIEGSGLVARLLRTTMGNFNMHEHVYVQLNNTQCLPQPTKLPHSFYWKIAFLYIGVFFLIYESTTFLRMRRLICAYFYRKHEKQRILYLYNNLLKQRRTLTRQMLKEAAQNFASRQKLRLSCPSMFGWLKMFNIAKRKCLTCDEYEDKYFVICPNIKCGMAYCHECWLDLDNNCLVCNSFITNEIILNFYSLFEEFTFV